MSSRSRFKLRNFTSALLLFSGLAMLTSGIVFYVMPEGRIAYWTDWRLINVPKEGWGRIHTSCSFLFSFFAIVHTILNWKQLMIYVSKATKVRIETLAAIFVTILFLTGSVAALPPFTTVMEVGKLAKKSWYVGEDVHPPFPHAEIMTLKQLCNKMDISLEGSLSTLRDFGYHKITPETTLKELALISKTSPMIIFNEMMLDDRVYN